MSSDLVVEGNGWSRVHLAFAASTKSAECERRASDTALDLDAPGERPPALGGTAPVPEAPTRHAAVGVRRYVHHRGPARQSDGERFGATLVRETADHPEGADDQRFALRMRRTGTPPFEFVFPPARREVPGEDAAECFAGRDCRDSDLAVRRAPEAAARRPGDA